MNTVCVCASEWWRSTASLSLSLPPSLSPSLSLDLPLCLSHPLSPSPTLLTQSYVIEVSISNSQELHGTNEWSQSRKFANIGICIAKCKLKRGEGLGVFSSSSLWEMDARARASFWIMCAFKLGRLISQLSLLITLQIQSCKAVWKCEKDAWNCKLHTKLILNQLWLILHGILALTAYRPIKEIGAHILFCKENSGHAKSMLSLA